jgi:hypothetical protein
MQPHVRWSFPRIICRQIPIGGINQRFIEPATASVGYCQMESQNITRSILLAGAVLLSVSISPLNAEASGAPWCAVMAEGDGDLPWACKYRSIEECRLNVIAGNRGFCNPNPSYVANPPELKNSRQASPTGSKTIAEKTIAKKESPRHGNANARTKIVASPITVKTPRQHDKSNAKSKNSVATKIETPQPAQSDDESNSESKNSVATKIETPQPAQSDDESNAESKNSVATKIETPQPAQSDDESNAESKNSVATKIETPQAPSPPKPSKPAKAAPAAPMTKAAAAQTLVKTISADKTKTQTYCDIAKLGGLVEEAIEEAEEKKDIEKIVELDQKMGELTTKLGPEYVALMAGLQDIDANSKDAEDIVLALAGLDKLCAK